VAIGWLTESQAVVGTQAVLKPPRANAVLNLTGFTVWRLRAFVCPQPVLLSRLNCAPGQRRGQRVARCLGTTLCLFNSTLE